MLLLRARLGDARWFVRRDCRLVLEFGAVCCDVGEADAKSAKVINKLADGFVRRTVGEDTVKAK